MTCLLKAYDLSVVMLCRSKCLVRGHVLVECLSLCGISCYLFCFAGGHFLLDDMIYLRIHIVGEHEYEFRLMLTYLTGSHAQLVDLLNWWTY